MTTPVLYEKQGPIAVITLNRPAARNALTPEMLCRLADAFIDFGRDENLRVAVLTGVGEQAFCAGGDLAMTLPLMTGERAPEDAWDWRVLNDPLVMAASSLRDFLLHKPVISAINGTCMAAGFELLLGTDIRIATRTALFGLPEVQRGLVPFAGSMVRLPRQIGYARAMELLLTGCSRDADQALQCGLVNRVLPAVEVRPAAMALAQQIARNGPLAVQCVKQTVLEVSGLPLQTGYDAEDRTRDRIFASADAKEGPLAFVEKRPPVYSGW